MPRSNTTVPLSALSAQSKVVRSTDLPLLIHLDAVLHIPENPGSNLNSQDRFPSIPEGKCIFKQLITTSIYALQNSSFITRVGVIFTRKWGGGGWGYFKVTADQRWRIEKEETFRSCCHLFTLNEYPSWTQQTGILFEIICHTKF